MAVFREKAGHFTLSPPHKPCYTNVVIADNPQRCYCRCNLISVILSLLTKIMAFSRRGTQEPEKRLDPLNNWMKFSQFNRAPNSVY
jgi:hypothetical protein